MEIWKTLYTANRFKVVKIEITQSRSGNLTNHCTVHGKVQDNFEATINLFNLKPTPSDPAVYVANNNRGLLFIHLHVEDCTWEFKSNKINRHELYNWHKLIKSRMYWIDSLWQIITQWRLRYHWAQSYNQALKKRWLMHPIYRISHWFDVSNHSPQTRVTLLAPCRDPYSERFNCQTLFKWFLFW